MQDGTVYIYDPGGFTNEVWQTLTVPGLVADDFVNIESIFALAPETHPNFSAAGGVIHFGYMRANTTGTIGVPTIMTQHGIDNWSVTVNSSPLVLSCAGFLPPFDDHLVIKNNSKRTIPVKMELFDSDGFLVTDHDIGVPPIINVAASGAVFGGVPVDEGELSPLGSASDGNFFRYDPGSEQWIHNLSTKQYDAPGTYTVDVVSGAPDAYIIDPSCTETFERLP